MYLSMTWLVNQSQRGGQRTHYWYADEAWNKGGEQTHHSEAQHETVRAAGQPDSHCPSDEFVSDGAYAVMQTTDGLIPLSNWFSAAADGNGQIFN